MMIRAYQPSDYFYLREILFECGIECKYHKFSSNHTFILGEREAFFTYYIDRGFPHLIHFAVSKNNRSVELARLLIKSFQGCVLSLGLTKAIIHSNNSYLSKFIEYYFKVKSYASDNNYKFYLVEV